MSAEIKFDVKPGLVDPAIAWEMALIEDQAREGIASSMGLMPRGILSILPSSRRLKAELIDDISENIKLSSKEMRSTEEEMRFLQKTIESNRTSNRYFHAFFEDLRECGDDYDIGSVTPAEREEVRKWEDFLRYHAHAEEHELFDSSRPLAQLSGPAVISVLRKLGFRNSFETYMPFRQNGIETDTGYKTHSVIFPPRIITSVYAGEEWADTVPQNEHSYTVSYERNNEDVKVSLSVSVDPDGAR